MRELGGDQVLVEVFSTLIDRDELPGHKSDYSASDKEDDKNFHSLVVKMGVRSPPATRLAASLISSIGDNSRLVT